MVWGYLAFSNASRRDPTQELSDMKRNLKRWGKTYDDNEDVDNLGRIYFDI